MTTEAKIGFGTLFAMGDDASPPVYTVVAEVTSVTPPSISRDAVEATHMASPQMWREFIMGLKDGGEVTLELNFVPGSQSTTDLLAQFDTDDVGPKRVTFPDGSRWDFNAGCTGFEPETPIDDKMSATATFKISGKPVLTQV